MAAGDYNIEQAKAAAADILFHNSNSLYGLGLQAWPYRERKDENWGEALSLAGAPESGSIDQVSAFNAFIKANPQVKYIWVQWLDYTSTMRGRMFPLQQFAKIIRKQRRLTIPQVAFDLLNDDRLASPTLRTGQFELQADMSSMYANVAKRDKVSSKSATVMAYGYLEDGEPYAECPRSTLRTMVNRLKDENGINLLCGFEIEFVILQRSSLRKYHPLTTVHSWSQISSETSRVMPILEEIVECLSRIGIVAEQFHPESAPSQFELILAPSSPVHAVDTLLKTRQIITDVVERHDLRASFHPRPFSFAAGSAAHSHISISPSTHESFFLAGILAHLPSILAFSLPQDDSYLRVKPGIWSGGEWVAWGTENKETPIRKISPGRWEVKAVDGLSNMYLAISALLAAGYLGIKNKLDLIQFDCDGKMLIPFLPPFLSYKALDFTISWS